eukprot:TRINITY_DN1676_c0_g2_i2.p1 TRINITY_DN1676_c0_g2~~TRINITY_DN1676_c0_g2_i2.p1  ORF type:complete len:396 (-),score=112.37 TRINITY_DN1676_c0_g2_i2:38-1225(-)
MDNSILWIEKYQPKSLEVLEYNAEIGGHLKELLEGDDFPHILFYGTSGAGKRTLAHCLLRELFGTRADKMKGETREFEKGKSAKVECTVISSPCHIEVTPAEAGNNDKIVVQKLIKEVAGSHLVAVENQKKFKVVIINEVDYLSKDAQAGLRRTMEKYMGNCRILMNCQCISKVIEPLKSRCLLVRVPSPSYEEIEKICKKIVTHEAGTISKEKLHEIAIKSKRNMRRAIMMLQAMLANEEKGTVPVPQYEIFIQEIATDVMREQSPRQLKEIREKFDELLVKLVPAREIFWILLKSLLAKTPKEIHLEIVAAAATYDHRAQIGSKPIMHLEAFTAKAMSIIRGNRRCSLNLRFFMLNAFLPLITKPKGFWGFPCTLRCYPVSYTHLTLPTICSV